MTIQDAIDILEKKKSQSNDAKLKNRIDSLINDLHECFGTSEHVDEQIAKSIEHCNTAAVCIDYAWVMHLNEDFLKIKYGEQYEKQRESSRVKVDKFKADIEQLKTQRKDVIKKNKKVKNITFWITISFVLVGVITTCVFALVQWIQKGKGIIDEPKWDMMALAGIIDAFIGVIGFAVERILDRINSKGIQDIDEREDKIYENLYGDLYIQYNLNGSTGYQGCKVYNITDGGIH